MIWWEEGGGGGGVGGGVSWQLAKVSTAPTAFLNQIALRIISWRVQANARAHNSTVQGHTTAQHRGTQQHCTGAHNSTVQGHTTALERGTHQHCTGAHNSTVQSTGANDCTVEG